MKTTKQDYPILTFKNSTELRSWLIKIHQKSDGIWVKIFKKKSGIESVTFEEVLDEGLCFGWSESKRQKGDDQSYLQLFTPRKKKGTASPRNRAHVRRLIKENRMTPFGLTMLDME